MEEERKGLQDWLWQEEHSRVKQSRGNRKKVCLKGRRSEGGEERRGEKVLARGD